MEQLYSKWIKVFPKGGGGSSWWLCLLMRLPGASCECFDYFLSSSWTAGVCLSTRYELLSSVERGALEEGWTVSVCQKRLFHSGTSTLAFLPTSWICLAKLMHGGLGGLRQKRYMDLVHNWIYSCHIQYISLNYLILLCCPARVHLS